MANRQLGAGRFSIVSARQQKAERWYFRKQVKILDQLLHSKLRYLPCYMRGLMIHQTDGYHSHSNDEPVFHNKISWSQSTSNPQPKQNVSSPRNILESGGSKADTRTLLRKSSNTEMNCQKKSLNDAPSVPSVLAEPMQDISHTYHSPSVLPDQIVVNHGVSVTHPVHSFVPSATLSSQDVSDPCDVTSASSDLVLHTEEELNPRTVPPPSLNNILSCQGASVNSSHIISTQQPTSFTSSESLDPNIVPSTVPDLTLPIQTIPDPTIIHSTSSDQVISTRDAPETYIVPIASPEPVLPKHNAPDASFAPSTSPDPAGLVLQTYTPQDKEARRSSTPAARLRDSRLHGVRVPCDVLGPLTCQQCTRIIAQTVTPLTPAGLSPIPPTGRVLTPHRATRLTYVTDRHSRAGGNESCPLCRAQKWAQARLPLIPTEQQFHRTAVPAKTSHDKTHAPGEDRQTLSHLPGAVNAYSPEVVSNQAPGIVQHRNTYSRGRISHSAQYSPGTSRHQGWYSPHELFLRVRENHRLNSVQGNTESVEKSGTKVQESRHFARVTVHQSRDGQDGDRSRDTIHDASTNKYTALSLSTTSDQPDPPCLLKVKVSFSASTLQT